MQCKTKKSLSALAVFGLCAACQTTPQDMLSQPDISQIDATAAQATGETRYFPAITYREVREIKFGALRNIGPPERMFFADQINLAATGGDRIIPIVVQTVGDGRKTLLFVALEVDDGMTPYIARAMLARMTSVLRFAPAISEMGVSQELDVYSMAAILGFERIIVTNGRAFSYEAQLARGLVPTD